MRRHGPVIAHCTDSEGFPKDAFANSRRPVDYANNIRHWSSFDRCKSMSSSLLQQKGETVTNFASPPDRENAFQRWSLVKS